MLAWFLDSKLAKWALVIGGALLIAWRALARAESKGRKLERQEMKDRDHANADEIRDRARNIDPADSVRDADPRIFRD